MTVRPLFPYLLLSGWLALTAFAVQAQQDTTSIEAKKPDTFFAGTIVETTPEKITVSRVVLGKTEKRDFKVTADTKVEGKLKPKVRVTVRYVAGEDGEIATLIVVRAATQNKKK
jgi:hypothetical protein